MIGYVTLGTNNLAKAVEFYEQLLAELGAKKVMSNERLTLFGTGPGAPMLGVCTPYDDKKASAGNGTMIALNVGNPDNVKKVHAKALALGGSDEGAPGPRGTGFFGGYFRDLDGNKFVAFCMG
jgi:catechol 2,3-dioxygenase-like lactoylglutathione lyase family enzyme